LLYLWHRRNERSHTGSRDSSATLGSPLLRPVSSPGTIIPISSQSGSSSERENAVETIKVFCHSQDRRLHAIIVPPHCSASSHNVSPLDSSTHSRQQSSVETSMRGIQQGERPSWICKQTSVTGAQQTDYEITLQVHLSEPLLVTKELLPLLRRNNGRVIFVEGCGDSNIFTSNNLANIFETARLSAVHTLRKELRNTVNVSIIHTGQHFGILYTSRRFFSHPFILFRTPTLPSAEPLAGQCPTACRSVDTNNERGTSST
jgi:hypothetical protein